MNSALPPQRECLYPTHVSQTRHGPNFPAKAGKWKQRSGSAVTQRTGGNSQTKPPPRAPCEDNGPRTRPPNGAASERRIEQVQTSATAKRFRRNVSDRVRLLVNPKRPRHRPRVSPCFTTAPSKSPASNLSAKPRDQRATQELSSENKDIRQDLPSLAAIRRPENQRGLSSKSTEGQRHRRPAPIT